jgi:hypothetical protein
LLYKTLFQLVSSSTLLAVLMAVRRWPIATDPYPSQLLLLPPNLPVPNLNASRDSIRINSCNTKQNQLN